jgi:hypothetical protein
MKRLTFCPLVHVVLCSARLRQLYTALTFIRVARPFLDSVAGLDNSIVTSANVHNASRMY